MDEGEEGKMREGMEGYRKKVKKNFQHPVTRPYVSRKGVGRRCALRDYPYEKRGGN